MGCSETGATDGPGVCAVPEDDTIATVATAASIRQRTLEKNSVIVEGKKRNCVRRSAVRLRERALGCRQRMEIEMGQLAKNLFVFLVAEQGHPGLLVAPNTVHDGECHQHPGSYHWIDLTKLPGLDTSPNDPTEQLESARDDFVGVEPGEIRELMQLAEDESINRTKDRGTDESPIAAHHGTELLGWSSLSDRFFARLDGSDGSLPDHLAEEVFLV